MNLLNGDCLEVLKTLTDNSVDSIVTDPPAGISFMGKTWDDDKGGRDEWIKWMSEVMAECKRVLKPGAHGLVWSIPRTSHWTAMALEDAGFEVRDCVTHLFGSGFPKSLDVSKAIDKAAGAERKVIGQNLNHRTAEDVCTMLGNPHTGTGAITAPATDAAKLWQGWGTALKPAAEFWWLVRKPCSENTVAENVLKWGTGALNIDASRIGFGAEAVDFSRIQDGNIYGKGECYGKAEQKEVTALYKPGGRWPANLLLSHSEECEESCAPGCPVAELDAQSGTLKSGANPTRRGSPKFRNSYAEFEGQEECVPARGADQGGASRFFYCAKISSSERNAGLEHLEPTEAPLGDDRPSGQSMSRLDGRPPRRAQNTHPTVKPKKLMGYLIKLITPPNGVVLDPFMGSGSTGLAAKECGFGFIGIEKETEYFQIASARIN